MAFREAFDAHPGSFENAPFLYGFDGVVGAGGNMPTGGREKRRNGGLVNADREKEDLDCDVPKAAH